MSRSVDYLTNADAVVYEDVSKMGWYKACTEDCAMQLGDVCDDCGADISKVEPEYCEMIGQDEWEWWLRDISDQIVARFPSIEEADYWDHRYHGQSETRIFLENRFVEVGVSEYMGLASISCRVHASLHDDIYPEDNSLLPLAERFVDNFSDWMKKNLGSYRKVATFSNGESMYEKA